MKPIYRRNFGIIRAYAIVIWVDCGKAWLALKKPLNVNPSCKRTRFGSCPSYLEKQFLDRLALAKYICY